MTFLAQESSVEAGRPIELYTFTLALEVFRYTSAEDDQVVGGNTYEAIAIKRSKVAQGPEARRSTLTLEMPGNLDLPARYVLSAPSERARVVIQRFHRGDGEVVAVFDGFVKSVAFDGGRDGRVAKLAIDPAITAASRQIPLFTYGAQCQNVLGDGFGSGTGLCDVDLDAPAFRHQATASAATGLTVTVPGASAFGAGWFDGGTIRTTAGTDARLIISQVGDVITLHIAFPFPVVGLTMILRAGCKRDTQTCSTKFNRINRYQGFPFIPVFNPFDGLRPERC
jgi:uncharacterized phage protein (TIGR02218 family)